MAINHASKRTRCGIVWTASLVTDATVVRWRCRCRAPDEVNTSRVRTRSTLTLHNSIHGGPLVATASRDAVQTPSRPAPPAARAAPRARARSCSCLAAAARDRRMFHATRLLFHHNMDIQHIRALINIQFSFLWFSE
ncbi:hypothetical protein MSG28_005924, partial [Choristoneura fumiferana]